MIRTPLRPGNGLLSGRVLLCLLVFCAWVSCKKDVSVSSQPAEPPKPAPSDGQRAEALEQDQTPVPGLDVDATGLAEKDRELLDTMLNELNSPCGDAQSLRKSALAGSGCKRGPFAARFVMQLVKDGAPANELREIYSLAYKDIEKTHEFATPETAPHKGPPSAPVKIVEFFDYGCPLCQMFKPEIDGALASYPQDAVVFYKMYPLPGHKDSGGAAQAALAAHEQGKFAEMHDALFADQHKHGQSDLMNHAAAIGLDMKKFNADFPGMAEKVDADRKEGGDLVDGTPTFFINGRKFPNLGAEYLKLRIEEERAVNR